MDKLYEKNSVSNQQPLPEGKRSIYSGLERLTNSEIEQLKRETQEANELISELLGNSSNQ